MPPTVKPSGLLCIGSNLELFTEDYYVREFKGFGLSRRTVRLFLSRVLVPAVYIARTRLYNRFSVLIALQAISRPGAKDFLFPSSRAIQKSFSRGIKPNQTTSLDPAYLAEHLPSIINEVVAFSQTKSIIPDATFRTALESAGRMMVMHSLKHPEP